VAELRRAGARGLQMGAGSTAPVQPLFSSKFTSGSRSVIILNVRFKGQNPTSNELCTMNQVKQGAEALRKLHGQRSFGKVTLSVTVVDCVLELSKASATEYTSANKPNEMIDDALKAAQSATCPGGAPFTAAQIAAFNHRVVYHPKLSAEPFDYHGLGSVFGPNVWMNGPTSDDGTLCHEVGHNYGLSHAAVWPYGGALIEYGDITDVMGGSRLDAHPYTDGMIVGDYSAGQKIALGWIGSNRYVALHPSGSSAASGLVNTASFPLAALDRDNAIGVDPFSAYPSDAAIAARITIPSSLHITSGKGGANAKSNSWNQFAYVFFRAKARVPGVYVGESAWGSNGMSAPYIVCNEPLCREQEPLAGANDAFVYDRNGTRALIEVGPLTAGVIPATAGIVNTDLQNSAYRVTVSHLGANGRKLGWVAASCNAVTGMCASDTYIDVTATGTYSESLSATKPVALYKVVNPLGGAVTINACQPDGQSYSVPIGVSAFLSGFPTAHAFHTGSVGVSGDAAAPGVVPSAPFSKCATTTVAVAAGRVVWVAVGSPGSFRGSALTASVTITLGGVPTPAVYTAVGDRISVPASKLSDNGDSFSGGYKQVVNLDFTCTVCASGSPVFQSLKDSKVYLVRQTGASDYKVMYAKDMAAGAITSYGAGSLTEFGACPKGSFNDGTGPCKLCPIPGQSSTGSAVSEADCFCPTGFYPTHTAAGLNAAGCTGQELGGPSAVPASAPSFPRCPSGKMLSATGACEDCPLGTVAANAEDAYGNGCVTKFYRTIEVVATGTTPSWLGGIFKRNEPTPGQYAYTRSAGDTDSWRIKDTGDWGLCAGPDSNMCYTASFDGNLRARAPQLFNTESLAFCDGAGDSTVDSLGRRVCYCGENMEKDNAGVCRACPAGKFRSVGGTKSKNEVCSCPTCPDASVGRMLAGQEPATSLTLAQLKDACGAVCKAEPYSAEPALAVSAMVPQFNADGEWDSLKVTWSGATSNSRLNTAGYKVRLSMYQLTGATAQNVSALWWWNSTDETDETKYYSASAGGGTVTIPYDWQADFDAQQPPVNVEGYCADNNFVALELLNASGAVVTTVYSPPFFLSARVTASTKGPTPTIWTLTRRLRTPSTRTPCGPTWGAPRRTQWPSAGWRRGRRGPPRGWCSWWARTQTAPMSPPPSAPLTV